MRLIVTIFSFLIATCLFAQEKEPDFVGKIVLNPYVDDNEDFDRSGKDLLLTKLNQLVTLNGCVGEGFDNRFIITAHLITLDEKNTSTVPTKVVVNLSVTIYIGDSTVGTLFSSANVEVKGMGEDVNSARKNAIRKINSRSPELLAAIEEGKRRISVFYEDSAPEIISKANALFAKGNYEEAIAELAVIPSNCSKYQE